jgi:hypothetical protein
MKINIDEETKKLINNRLMLNNMQINAFEEAMANIFSLNDVNHIEKLCLGFDDKTEQDDVMFGLIHSIEAYDKTFGMEESTNKFISASKNLTPHATNWLDIMLIRYLNDDGYRNVLKKELKKADIISKNVILEALNRISLKDSNTFAPLIKSVLE